DRDARIWDVARGGPVRLLRGPFGPVFGASFSPDGRWVVTAGPTTGGLWDASTGRLMFYLRGHTEPLTAASFSPDGRRILPGSRPRTDTTAAREEFADRLADIAAFDRLLVSLVRVSADERLTQEARDLVAGERPRRLERRGREHRQVEEGLALRIAPHHSGR